MDILKENFAKICLDNNQKSIEIFCENMFKIFAKICLENFAGNWFENYYGNSFEIFRGNPILKYCRILLGKFCLNPFFFFGNLLGNFCKNPIELIWGNLFGKCHTTFHSFCFTIFDLHFFSHFSFHNFCFTLSASQFLFYNFHFSLFVSHFLFYTFRFTLFVSHFHFPTFHFTPFVSHSLCHTFHFTLFVSHFLFHTFCFTLFVSHFLYHTFCTSINTYIHTYIQKNWTNPNLTNKQIWLWDEVKLWHSRSSSSRNSALNILCTDITAKIIRGHLMYNLIGIDYIKIYIIYNMKRND